MSQSRPLRSSSLKSVQVLGRAVRNIPIIVRAVLGGDDLGSGSGLSGNGRPANGPGRRLDAHCLPGGPQPPQPPRPPLARVGPCGGFGACERVVGAVVVMPQPALPCGSRSCATCWLCAASRRCGPGMMLRSRIGRTTAAIRRRPQRRSRKTPRIHFGMGLAGRLKAPRAVTYRHPNGRAELSASRGKPARQVCRTRPARLCEPHPPNPPHLPWRWKQFGLGKLPRRFRWHACRPRNVGQSRVGTASTAGKIRVLPTPCVFRYETAFFRWRWSEPT